MSVIETVNKEYGEKMDNQNINTTKLELDCASAMFVLGRNKRRNYPYAGTIKKSNY